MYKGNLKSLNSNCREFVEFVQMFGPHLGKSLHLMSDSKQNIINFIFSGKIVTCLSYIFTMQKALVKIILERSFVNRYSIFLGIFLEFLESKG